MKPARSPARYSAALATSSSVPIRAIGRNERTNCIAYFLQLMSIQTSFMSITAPSRRLPALLPVSICAFIWSAVTSAPKPQRQLPELP